MITNKQGHVEPLKCLFTAFTKCYPIAFWASENLPVQPVEIPDISKTHNFPYQAKLVQCYQKTHRFCSKERKLSSTKKIFRLWKGIQKALKHF